MPTDTSLVRFLPAADELPGTDAGTSANDQTPTDGDEDAVGAPWQEGDFTPFFAPEPGDYVADGGETFRVTAGEERVRICAFVPEPQAERSIIHNLDKPEADTTSTVTVRITTPAGDDVVVDVPVEKGRNLSAAVIDAVPSGVAKLSVSNRTEVGRAAAAFTSPTFASRTMYGQTGWLADGHFAFPGSEDVSLERLGTSPGVNLLSVPPAPDVAYIARGAETLLRIYRAAPPEVSGGIVGSIAGGPMFRQQHHLGARAHTTLVAGPTGIGKTLLVTRNYSLLGSFTQQPGCIATFRTTLPTLEAFLHTLRDLPVFVDNFRLADQGVREKFRALVISVGDGTGRGRSTWGRDGHKVVGAPGANSLLLATGEDSFTDDAAVSARLLEFHADCIDRTALLRMPQEDLRCLPHVFSGFIHFLRMQSPEVWARRRADMAKLTEYLIATAGARTSEHLATVATALVTFCDYLCRVAPGTAAAWDDIARAFLAAAPGIAQEQASRVRDERVDQVVLREIARALREGKACLQPGRGARPSGGVLLGSFDADFIYLIPDITTKWASAEVRSRARGADVVGRKGLAWALQARGDENGKVVFRTIAGKRTRTWRVRRDGLGDDWDGLLTRVPRRRGAPLDPQSDEGEP
jgi:hypothetical protein